MLLSGCWDKVEIDRRNFIATIAVDSREDITKDKKLKNIKPKDSIAKKQTKKINVTYGFPDMSMLGPGKSGTAQDKYINADAYSMEDAYSEATAKSSRDLYMGHTKLLILSSNLLKHKETIKEIVDYLQRNPIISRTMQVVASDGVAKDYVEFKPMTEISAQYYISGLMDNSKRNSRIMSTTLNEFLILLSENGNALLPRISIDKDKKELMLSGAAIIKDYELKGYFTPMELMDIQLLNGKFKVGKKVVYVGGHPVDYVIDGYTKEMKVVEEGNKLVINVNINLEGQISEYYVGKKLLDKNELQTLQNTFNKSISKECKKVMEDAIGKFGIDPFGTREYIEKFKPALWNKIEKNWNEEYKKMSVNVIVKSEIRRIGAVQ